MRPRLAVQAACLLLTLPLSGAVAFAAGEGGAGTGTSSPTVTQCKKGEVWDKKRGKCVVAKKQSMLDDDSIYAAGRDLAMVGRYGEAIGVLSLTANKADPRILNYLGYSHRKQGRVLVGLGYYEEALRVDPNYTLVREYLGEAHLQLGDVPAARQQLAEIEKRCGKGCAEYADLSAQIDAFVKAKS